MSRGRNLRFENRIPSSVKNEVSDISHCNFQNQTLTDSYKGKSLIPDTQEMVSAAKWTRLPDSWGAVLGEASGVS